MKRLLYLSLLCSLFFVSSAHAEFYVAGGNSNQVSVQDNKHMISVYPNPCQSSTHITISPVAGKWPTELKIYDLLGKELLRIPVIDQEGLQYSIDLSQVQAGIYFCSVYAHNKVLETRKIVKVK
jgi:hypothetical protein